MLQYKVLITGANQGLGLEFTRQYAADSWQVFASCRNLVQAKALQQLARHFSNIVLFQLDVTNPIQLTQVAKKLATTSIDLLINNAGIYPNDGLDKVCIDTMKHAFLTNAVAPLKVAETFLGNVIRSHLKTIVSISSKMGSIAENSSGEDYSYRASKAALNMIMRTMSRDLQHENVKVFMIHPGSVKTAIGGPNAAITAEQSVSSIRTLLLRLTQRDTGHFFDYMGNAVDW